MKILMLSPIPLFPANAGDRVRIWQIAQGLANHALVTLVVPYHGQTASTIKAINTERMIHSFNHRQSDRADRALGRLEEQEQTHQVGLHLVPTATSTPTRIRQLQSILSRRPYHVALRYDSQIRQTVHSLLALNSYDLIYCHFLYTVPYALHSRLPIVLDQHNADRIYWQRKLTAAADPLRQWVTQQNLAKTVAFEESILPALASIISVSEQDSAFMQGYATPTVPHFLVAPNGVDVMHYQPRTSPITQGRPGTKARLTLGFLGSMELALNQEAVLTLLREIYPAVCQRLVDWEVQLVVIGRQPPNWLSNWADEHQDPTVTVTGDVPDILPYLQQLDLMILPLQNGAGTKLRVLEAMAAGVCIVGTPLAFDGLDAITVGHHAFIAQDAHEFVEVICDLATNVAQRQATAGAARRLVERVYDWSTITKQLALELQTIYGTTDGTSKQPRSATTISESVRAEPTIL